MQAANRARFDAGRLESNRDAIIAERAFEDFARFRTEFRNVEGTAGHAITATDAILFLKIDDPVRVLHDGGIGRACGEAAWILTMHALILTHQQHEAAIFALVLVELDQVPV